METKEVIGLKPFSEMTTDLALDFVRVLGLNKDTSENLWKVTVFNGSKTAPPSIKVTGNAKLYVSFDHNGIRDITSYMPMSLNVTKANFWLAKRGFATYPLPDVYVAGPVDRSKRTVECCETRSRQKMS